MLKLGKNAYNGQTWDEGGKNEIVQILISHQQNQINSLQFVYAEKGEMCHSKIFGKPVGCNFNIVTLDYPSEFLTSVSGVDNDKGLEAITFGTNMRMYGPFGNKNSGSTTKFESNSFKFEFGHKSCFGGFHGCVGFGGRVLAIGIYIKHITSFADLKSIKSQVESIPTSGLLNST